VYNGSASNLASRANYVVTVGTGATGGGFITLNWNRQ
jgi:hypothetical protein